MSIEKDLLSSKHVVNEPDTLEVSACLKKILGQIEREKSLGIRMTDDDFLTYASRNWKRLLEEKRKMAELIAEADQYLYRNDGITNFIGTGSILHQKMQRLLREVAGEG